MIKVINFLINQSSKLEIMEKLQNQIDEFDYLTIR